MIKLYLMHPHSTSPSLSLTLPHVSILLSHPPCTSFYPHHPALHLPHLMSSSSNLPFSHLTKIYILSRPTCQSPGLIDSVLCNLLVSFYLDFYHVYLTIIQLLNMNFPVRKSCNKSFINAIFLDQLKKTL